jgi:exodeoxyribonuclease III
VRVVTWNVNSIRQRLERAKALLERHRPDVLCLQETKVTDEDFPSDEFRAMGFESATLGQKAYNGVAILSRSSMSDVRFGFPGDPVPEESRVICGLVGGVRVICAYGVNGKQVNSPSYEVKLAWFDALAAWIFEAFDPGEPLLLVGDLNVAPDDRDVHDPGLWRGKNLASEPERDRIRRILQWGMVDLLRSLEDGPGPFTWWDYRAGSFHRGWGLRIDLALGTRPVAERCTAVTIDREERKPSTGEGKPSDHAPVIVDLD